MLTKILFFIIALSNVWPHLNASAQKSNGALQVAAVVAAAAEADAAKAILQQAGAAAAAPATDTVATLKRKRVASKASSTAGGPSSPLLGSNMARILAGKQKQFKLAAAEGDVQITSAPANALDLKKASAASKENAAAMEDDTSAKTVAEAVLAAAAQEQPQKPVSKKGHCATCNKTFKNLERHAFIHTGAKPFACTQCDHRCNRESNMKLHMKNMHKAKYVSPAVDLKKGAEAAAPADQSASASMLDADSAQDNSSAAAASAVADALSCCGRTYKNSHALNIHLGKSSKHKENAEAQAAPDADEESEAADPSLAKQPKRKKAKPNVDALVAAKSEAIICTECNQKFSTTQGLGSHLKHKHPDAVEDAGVSAADEDATETATAASEFACTHADCGKVMPSRQGLINHMRTHRSATDASNEQAADEDTTATEEFQCTHADCNRVFKRQQDLNRHANSHNKKWYYPSDEDEERDDSHKADKPLKKRASAAAAAIALQAKTKSFACKMDGCTETFKNAKELKKHSWQGHPWSRSAKGAAAAAAYFPCTYDGCIRTFKHAKRLSNHIEKMHTANASAKEDSDDDAPLATKLKSATEESADAKVQSEILALKQRLQLLTQYEEQQRKQKEDEMRLKDQEKRLKQMREALFGNTGK